MCEGHVDPKLERSVFDLVDRQRMGKVSRRDFLKQATALLGGAVAADALWLAATGAPIPEVAAALGALSPRDPTTEHSFAQADINTQTVSLTAFGSDGGGFLAYPKNAANALAVVVIQEWWGINDQIKGVAVRFAQAGFAALAPDLYRGQVAQQPRDAQRLMMAVQMPQAIQDVQAGIDYLTAQPFVAPKQAGIVGFCVGGGLAMTMAYKGHNVGAVATFYGAGVNPTDADLKTISAPIIGFYGGKDNSIPADRIAHWYSTLAADGKIAEYHTYSDAAHAFFNETEASYNKAAAEDSWPRVLDWFRKYIPIESF